MMGHWDYTQKYRCCIYFKIRSLGQPSQPVPAQLGAACHREEEGWGAAGFGGAGVRWPDSLLQQCCGTILMPVDWSHLQLSEPWATGPAALHIGPDTTLGLSDLVL